LDPGTDFEPNPPPKPGDWLAAHPESGQSFEEFVRSRPNRPDQTRNKIYLHPLGDFLPEGSPPVEFLKEYAEVFFGVGTQILSPKANDNPRFTTRINPFNRKRQILSTDVLSNLRSLLTRDAFCLLAITVEALYPDPAWKFFFRPVLFERLCGSIQLCPVRSGFLWGEAGKRGPGDPIEKEAVEFWFTRRAICFPWLIAFFFAAS
jgi:archaemetzincin